MIKITTTPKTDMDLLVCAELKQYQECESLTSVVQSMRDLLANQKKGTICLDYAYRFKTALEPYRFELWHHRPDGTPDRKIAEMEVER